MTLTMSIVGITAMASMAQAAPRHPAQPGGPDARQQQAAPHRHGVPQYGAIPQGRKVIFIKGMVAAAKQRSACTCTDKQGIAKQRWQRKMSAQRQGMQHRRQQWHQRRQQMGSCPCGTEKQHRQNGQH